MIVWWVRPDLHQALPSRLTRFLEMWMLIDNNIPRITGTILFNFSKIYPFENNQIVDLLTVTLAYSNHQAPTENSKRNQYISKLKK
ncbi:hypothetical protein [Metabacillus litoralis]|jgi:hypothetical protein|uniref:hypothetical protein n=1 Tax=Metabacillus litoralis TaxID=152268 RepID=UPI00203DA061|nr:hypothetical protein [Metabacillus litoralis]